MNLNTTVHSDEEIDPEITKTAQDVTETVLQLRLDNEQKQRKIASLQQLLVS